MKNNLIVLGAGGHGKVIADAAESSDSFNNIFFLDDKKYLDKKENLLNFPIIGNLENFNDFIDKDISFAVGIGNPEIRLNWLEKLKGLNCLLPAIIHPSAIISKYSKICDGSVILSNAVVQTSTVVGFGSILNTSSSIDHDVKLSKGVHICPGSRIAGNVSIGEMSWIGIGSTIIENINIGSDVFIGAGSVVVKDIPNGAKSYGNPSKIINFNKVNY